MFFMLNLPELVAGVFYFLDFVASSFFDIQYNVNGLIYAG